MRISLFKVFVLVVISLGFACGSWAQNSTSSPYSMYGVGLISQKEDVCAAGLGHTGIALAPNEWVNISNPAGLCGLDSLTFYFNFQLKGFHAREFSEKQKQSVYSANIDAITMGFRARRWLAMSIGYAPFSSVGYNFSEIKHIAGDYSEYVVNHRGAGGVQQAFINASFVLFNHLSLGGNFSALWGSISKKEIARFTESIGGEDITNNRKYTMNNIYWEVGAQGFFSLGQNNFRLGCKYSPKVSLYSSLDHVVSNQTVNEFFHDDLMVKSRGFSVPEIWATGFTYSRRRVLFSADYRLERWSKITNYKYHEVVNFRDSHFVGAGLQYSAGERNMPFYKRMRYRVGGFYSREYLDIYKFNLKYYGATLGLSIPAGRSANYINLSFEISRRGDNVANLVLEQYRTFKLAFNVHETWFVKSKFD